jgi:hypothetical protein
MLTGSQTKAIVEFFLYVQRSTFKHSDKIVLVTGCTDLGILSDLYALIVLIAENAALSQIYFIVLCSVLQKRNNTLTLSRGSQSFTNIINAAVEAVCERDMSLVPGEC